MGQAELLLELLTSLDSGVKELREELRNSSCASGMNRPSNSLPPGFSLSNSSVNGLMTEAGTKMTMTTMMTEAPPDYFALFGIGAGLWLGLAVFVTAVVTLNRVHKVQPTGVSH
jgi:hypothetical protein